MRLKNDETPITTVSEEVWHEFEIAYAKALHEMREQLRKAQVSLVADERKAIYSDLFGLYE